jgi:hypothetical protein
VWHEKESWEESSLLKAINAKHTSKFATLLPVMVIVDSRISIELINAPRIASNQ